MRPYLAIIRDSFAEALASRVLWLLLLAVTLVLLALAPLGYREQRTLEFARADIMDAKQLVQTLDRAYRDGKPGPARRVWSLVDPKTRADLVHFQQNDKSRDDTYYEGVDLLVKTLNGLLRNRDLYRESDWQDLLLDSETRDLLGIPPEKLSADDLARRNRLLIEKTCNDCFRGQPPRQVIITYATLDASPALRFSLKQVQQFIGQLLIPGLMGVLLGIFAVFTAILVTAPIIPQMFDPGSLSLLLSKPLSRSLLFLAKFVGGCAFILINVAYLVFGLWLILGTRFHIWNHRLLLCIPIFLFLFAIYYAVSAFAGVVWRNAVVSVVMTVVVWLLCFSVGTTKALFEQFLVESQRIIRLVPAGETMIALNERGATERWDDKTRQWEEVFLEHAHGPMGSVLGPVYDAQSKSLYAAQVWSRRFFRSGPTLLYGKAADGWRTQEGPTLPDGTFALLPDPKGRLLIVTTDGVQRLVGDLEHESKKVEFMWMKIPTSFGKPFQSAGPRTPLGLSPPLSASVNPGSGDIAVYSRGQLLRLRRVGSKYELAKSVQTDVDEEQGAAVAYSGKVVLLALSDGRILCYRAEDLTLQQTYQPEPESQPRFLAPSPDGRWFGIVFHNGALDMLDTTAPAEQAMWRAPVTGQEDISAVLFLSDKQILVADRATRVTRYDVPSWTTNGGYAPALSTMELAFYYVVMPIYYVFPKPGELDNTVLYLLQGKETTDMGLAMNSQNIERKRPALHPWAPVWSSLAFLVVVLVAACIYIERQDF